MLVIVIFKKMEENINIYWIFLYKAIGEYEFYFFTEILSHVHTPDLKIARAAAISQILFIQFSLSLLWHQSFSLRY